MVEINPIRRAPTLVRVNYERPGNLARARARAYARTIYISRGDGKAACNNAITGDAFKIPFHFSSRRRRAAAFRAVLRSRLENRSPLFLSPFHPGRAFRNPGLVCPRGTICIIIAKPDDNELRGWRMGRELPSRRRQSARSVRARDARE